MTHLVRLVVAAAYHVIARGHRAVIIQLSREADRHELKKVMGRHEK